MHVYNSLQSEAHLWSGPLDGDFPTIGDIVVVVIKVTGHTKVGNLWGGAENVRLPAVQIRSLFRKIPKGGAKADILGGGGGARV